jgi:acyl carrier protein
METDHLKGKIRTLLAEFLGVEPSDIGYEDDFAIDLQMDAAALVDFQEKLNSSGIDVSNLNFNQIHNIDDLVDALEGADVGHLHHSFDNPKDEQDEI